jgi:hypothetical protein
MARVGPHFSLLVQADDESNTPESDSQDLIADSQQSDSQLSSRKEYPLVKELVRKCLMYMYPESELASNHLQDTEKKNFYLTRVEPLTTEYREGNPLPFSDGSTKNLL